MNPKTETLEMIDRFLRFETTSRGSNLELIGFVESFLKGWGIESHLTYDDTRTKANLFATIGPSDKPGIILSGHTDTVPVDGQAWTCEPFALTARGDRFLGRGVTDMKGFLAIALAQVPHWMSQPLSTPLHLALSYDEEVGCLGVPRLIDEFSRRGVPVRGCIVGEPTRMQVVRGHKGKIGVHVTVIGKEAHTGVPHLGVNAIEIAAEIISGVRRIAQRQRDEGPFDRDFEAPPYTTLQTGLIQGGNAVNTVAGRCEFDFDIRHLPAVSPLSLLAELKTDTEVITRDAQVHWHVVPGCEALDTRHDDDIVKLALELSQTTSTAKVGFGTEAGYFQKAGIPTVLCGPGSIDQAHKPDEYLERDQIVQCEHFMKRLARYAR